MVALNALHGVAVLAQLVNRDAVAVAVTESGRILENMGNAGQNGGNGAYVAMRGRKGKGKERKVHFSSPLLALVLVLVV